MAEINGSFITEIDGVQFYTDGIIHSGGSISINIAYIDFSREWDNISDTGAWQIGASTGFPIVNVDSDGNVRVGGSASVFDAGVIRYADGTIGVYGGASIGGPLLGLSYSTQAGGGSATNNLATYDYYSVAADGTTQLHEHFSGDAQYPLVKIRITQLDENGNPIGDPIFTNIGDPAIAAEMGLGIAPHIYDEQNYWGLNQCFIAGTLITMWDGSKKPIEDITPDDWVMSFDEAGKKVPGRVTHTFQSEAKIILNFHGVGVTPGHVYYCAGGKYEGKFATLIDIIRDDGVVQHEDGRKIRAATGFDVSSYEDTQIWAFTTYVDEDGTQRVKAKRKLRLGTRFLRSDGMALSIAGHLKMMGMRLRDDGYVEDESTGIRTLYQWCFDDTLPNPEDYILELSKTTLADIYKAGEWEGVRPQMPPPMVLDGGPVQALPKNKLHMMPRNEPVIGKQATKKKLH